MFFTAPRGFIQEKNGAWDYMKKTQKMKAHKSLKHHDDCRERFQLFIHPLQSRDFSSSNEPNKNITMQIP